MEIRQQLNLTQKLKHVQGPRLYHFTKLLALPLPQLVNYLEAKADENPFLEYSSPYDDKLAGASDEGTWDENVENPKMDPDLQRKRDYAESLLTNQTSLEDLLLRQLHIAVGEGQARSIGEYLIGNLDEHGYLTVSVEEVAVTFAVPEQEVEDVRKKIQQFSPQGSASLSVQDCLLSQLSIKKYHQREEKLLRSCFEGFIAMDVAGIAKKLKIPVEDVKESFTQIKQLNLYPRGVIETTGNSNIKAEFRLVKEEDKFSVVDDLLPKVFINQEYETMLQEGDKETKDFLREKFKEAKMVADDIQNRKKMLKSVIVYIAQKQKAYLANEEPLSNLTLDDIASDVKLDKSTVSRALSGKYVEYEGNLFKLKDLIVHHKQKTIAKNEVEEEMVKVIEEEDKAHPLSDHDLEKKLKEKGHTVSRRTVTKYRLKMHIPNAYNRKRQRILEQ